MRKATPPSVVKFSPEVLHPLRFSFATHCQILCISVLDLTRLSLCSLKDVVRNTLFVVEHH